MPISKTEILYTQSLSEMLTTPRRMPLSMTPVCPKPRIKQRTFGSVDDCSTNELTLKSYEMSSMALTPFITKLAAPGYQNQSHLLPLPTRHSLRSTRLLTTSHLTLAATGCRWPLICATQAVSLFPAAV